MDAIGTLTGGIAHDFNNLLTVILGNSNIAMNEIDKKSQTYKEIKEINIAATRAASLTRQLLLYSRKQPMGFYTLQINETINNLIKMLERLLGEDVKIKLELEPDILSVKADLSNIEQVITNICINARDAMPKGGIITIKTENIFLSEDESKTIEGSCPGDNVRLSIVDSGFGMDKETVKHIFEPFFTTKGLGKGTGLGLSVVYGIIKAHNGWINVYSEPGHGTIFKVSLPATKSETTVISEVKAEPKQLNGKGEHVLIIEDDDAVLGYIERILSKNNYYIHKTISSKNAVEVFKENSKSIDLVITDMILTDENGLDTIDKLKQIKNNIGVIICSGYLDDKSNFLAIQEKGYKFIQKPFEITNMLKTIRQILDEKI
jgi:ActR/RegA family two-component response regulator